MTEVFTTQRTKKLLSASRRASLEALYTFIGRDGNKRRYLKGIDQKDDNGGDHSPVVNVEYRQV
jgi:hypothetical protein